MSGSTRPPSPLSRTWRDLDARRMHAMVEERLFGGPPAPTEIGRFRVEHQLGAGAMGVVYAARDDQLGRRVALKLLHPHLEGDDLGRARLLREARAMARLEHENVARIYEVGEWDGQIYLAMELIEGVTLDVWLRAARRRWPEVLAVFVQAGRALAAAHRAGLLHRDFKPENVLVDARGRAHVLDFGLTRALDPQGLDGDLAAPLTRVGSILGTPAYMAPEQLRAGVASPRSDQFGLCVALFEALHGVRPFERVPRVGPVVLTPVPKDSRVPARIRRAVARGLAERPEDRWPDIDALLHALERPSRAHVAALAGGALAGALVVGLLATWQLRAKQAELDLAAGDLEGRDQRLVALRGSLDSQAEAQARREQSQRLAAAAVAVLPDDPTAALLLLREAGESGPLAARALAEPIAAAIFTGHQGPVQWARFSGTAVETLDAAGARRRFHPDGRPAKGPLDPPPADPPDLAPVRGPDPCRDHPGVRAPDGGGARIACSNALGEVWLLARAERPRRLAGAGAAVRALAWAPGDQRLALGRDDGAIEVVRLRDRHLTRLTGHDDPVTALAFRADGRLASGGEDGSARLWFPGAHHALAARVLRGHTGPIRSLAFEPGTDRLLTASDDGTARLWDPWPLALAAFDLGGPINALAWSGDLLAAAGDRGVGLRVLPLAGGPARALVDDVTVHAAAWSPDGRWLAAVDARGGVTLFPREGGEPRRLPAARRALLALAWHPRGDRLAVGGLDEAITVFDLAGDAPGLKTSLGRGTIEALAWAPGGDGLAAATSDGSLVVEPADPRAERRFLDAHDQLNDLAWSSDGAQIALAGDRRLRVATLAAKDPLATLRPSPAWSVAWREGWLAAGGPDGSFALWRPGEDRPQLVAAHGDLVYTLAFAPGGGRLASGGADGRVVLWPLDDEGLRRRLADATTACLSPARRRQLLREPDDLAAIRATACEAAAGRR